VKAFGPRSGGSRRTEYIRGLARLAGLISEENGALRIGGAIIATADLSSP
jgi:hypothetical protein